MSRNRMLAKAATQSAWPGGGTSKIMDRNNNKIFDSLEPILARASDDDKMPVLIMTRSEKDLQALEKVAGGLEVKYRYKVVPAVAAIATKRQVLMLAKQPFVQHIEYDAEVHITLDGANRWFGTAKARSDFGVTGNHDGSASYSKNDIVMSFLDLQHPIIAKPGELSPGFLSLRRLVRFLFSNLLQYLGGQSVLDHLAHQAKGGVSVWDVLGVRKTLSIDDAHFVYPST